MKGLQGNLKLSLLPFLFAVSTVAKSATCPKDVDLLLIGDSQVGATWAKSYTGNFLQQCLKGRFVIYGRGATIPGNWFGNGGMDQIETIQRDADNAHLNIGSLDQVPLCKKRMEAMLPAHSPKRIVFSFGGNYIGKTIDEKKVKQEISRLMEIIAQYDYREDQCFFVGPTFEMEVRERRNVAHRDLTGVMKIDSIVRPLLSGKCQFLSGVDLMRSSPYVDGKELLKRVQIPGASGCAGAAENDNVHVCGEAARDYAQRLCDRLN
jgi:hypothetical protein